VPACRWRNASANPLLARLWSWAASRVIPGYVKKAVSLEGTGSIHKRPCTACSRVSDQTRPELCLATQVCTRLPAQHAAQWTQGPDVRLHV